MNQERSIRRWVIYERQHLAPRRLNLECQARACLKRVGGIKHHQFSISPLDNQIFDVQNRAEINFLDFSFNISLTFSPPPSHDQLQAICCGYRCLQGFIT